MNGVVPSVTIEPKAYNGPNASLNKFPYLLDVCLAFNGELSINSIDVASVTTLPKTMLFVESGLAPPLLNTPLLFM